MTLKGLNCILALSSALLLAACTSSTTPVSDNPDNDILPSSEPAADGAAQRMFVNHHKSECHGLAPQLCMLVRGSEQDDWTYFYDGIENFEFIWGYSYELLVSVHEVPDPPLDGSSREYRLIRTISMTPAPAQSKFDFPSVYAPELIRKTSDNIFQIGFERLLSCTPENCETMASLLDQQFSMLLELKYATDPTAPLELAQIKCSDAEVSFRENCLP